MGTQQSMGSVHEGCLRAIGKPGVEGQSNARVVALGVGPALCEKDE